MRFAAGFALLSLASIVSAQDIAGRGDHGSSSRKPLVESSKIQKTIESHNLLDHAKNFVKFAKSSNGTRAFGSVGHNATVQYIKKLLDKTKYYDTELQTFPYLFSDGKAAFSANGTVYNTAWFTYGPSGDVTAPLVLVDNVGCELADYPAASVAGQIALIKRGTCAFGLKTALAGAAGAAGAIIYNNADGAIGGGTLAEVSRPEVGPYVPVGSLSGVDGSALVATISAGSQVVGTLHVDAVTETRWSSNVLATTKIGDKENVIMAGGHTDSVAAGAGINDDGSGSMGLLEVAIQLSKFSIKNAVRFAFWTAEEFGLVGSAHYATNLSEDDRQKVALYLNFDMIASPNGGYFTFDGDGSAFNVTGPAGSEHIEKTFEGFFVKKKLTSAPTAFTGRSDYGSFTPLGIPAGGLFTGSDGIKTAEQAGWWGGKEGVAFDACYHQACDGIDNLNVPVWATNTKAISHAIATYSRSLEGIPRGIRTIAREIPVTLLSYDDRRHQACGEQIPWI